MFHLVQLCYRVYTVKLKVNVNMVHCMIRHSLIDILEVS